MNGIDNSNDTSGKINEHEGEDEGILVKNIVDQDRVSRRA